MDTLCVYAYNFSDLLAGFEFAISYPPAVIWVADIVTADVVQGTTPTGISIGYGMPVVTPFLMMRVLVMWNCDNCEPPFLDNPIIVIPHPITSRLAAVRWLDGFWISAIGMTTMICSTLPAEETTWGKVKALYIE
ncbi:MAG: hypothetical protein JSW58_09455 [Candidatus Latescibacterota bacterium]|nr:MAG: hypothetical protein JSW58_09455 [Candidatus Latescibacterota bacterium]